MQRKQQCWVVDNSYIDATTSRQGCTPYGAKNSYLATLITNALGKKMILCTQCHSNINKPPNSDIQFTKHIWNSMLQPNLYMSNCCLFLTLECTSNQKIRDSVLASLWALVFSIGLCLVVMQGQNLLKILASSLNPLLSRNLDTYPFFEHIWQSLSNHKRTQVCAVLHRM